MVPKFKGNDRYAFLFTAREFSGELIDSPEGQLEWIKDKELQSLNRWESVHIFFPRVETGEFFSSKFSFDGDKMRRYEVAFHPPIKQV